MTATNLTIAVDIDGTAITKICDDWFTYLQMNYDFKLQYNYLRFEPLDFTPPYNLTQLFNVEDNEGFEFFDNKHLYDFYEPRQDALEFITRLHEEGNDIVFVSKIMGCHEESKRKWVNTWFPYTDFVATAKKKHIRCDYIIDDSVIVLNDIPLDVSCIRFRNDYSFPVPPMRSMKTVYNFQEAYEFIQTRGGDWN